MVRRARRIAREDVLPVAAARDRNRAPGEAYPWDIAEKIDAAGLRTLTVPEKFGGFGARHLVQAMVAEELAYGDLGVAVSMDQTYKFTQLLANETTQAQRDLYLEDFLNDPRALLALAVGWDMKDRAPVRLNWERVHRFRVSPSGEPRLAEPNIELECAGAAPGGGNGA